MDKHEVCDICNAPQWIMPNGEHRCMTLEQLHERYEMDSEIFAQLQKYISNIEKQIDKCKAENEVLRSMINEQVQSQKNFGKS